MDHLNKLGEARTEAQEGEMVVQVHQHSIGGQYYDYDHRRVVHIQVRRIMREDDEEAARLMLEVRRRTAGRPASRRRLSRSPLGSAAGREIPVGN